MLLSDELLLRKLRSRSAPQTQTGCRCWRKAAPYGKLWNGERLEGTHRISWRIHKGPIPDGMDVLHTCDTPACWEPDHLFLGTQADNNRDRATKGRNGLQHFKGRKKGPSPQRGDKHKRAKLTPEQVREIRKAPEKHKTSWLAAKYGISPSLVYGIRKRRNWAWLD